MNWLFNVTINDISVTHVCRRPEENLDLRSGSQRHRHFEEFFNDRHGTNLFIQLFRETAPFSRFIRYARDTEDVFST